MRTKLTVIVFLVANAILYARLDVKKPTQDHPTSFAIVIDEETYHEAKDAVLAYRDAVENDGLSTYILINDWKNPDEIRSEIIKLYNQQPPLEGIVLVGDIPIPMIRNAEHLTSSFKYENNSLSYFNSSVPSDRFYDDFNLQFRYLTQDEENKLCFYYS
ncbi:MAG: HEAT repeat domain-containing protein, partial [Ignavibacteriales bacterium]